MESVRVLVERLGGGSAVAARLGVTPSAVSLWVANDRVPPARQAAVVKLARERAVDWTPPGFEGLLAQPGAAQ